MRNIYVRVCYALIEKEPYNVQIALMCWLEESPYREDFVQRYIERIPHFTRTRIPHFSI